MEVLGRGRQATVYALSDDLAVKVFEPWIDESSVRREAELADAVYQLGAPAPRIDRLRQRGGGWTIEFERLPGPLLIEELLIDPWETAADLGRLVAAIHALDGSGLQEVRDQWLDRIELPEIVDIERTIRSTAGLLPDGRSLLHTDLHPFNVMRNRNGEWIAIDWDGAAHGHPAAELCRTLFLLVEADGPEGPSDPGLASLRAEAGSVFMDAYRRVARPVEDEQIAAWRPVMLAARLGEDIAHERRRLIDELRRLRPS